MSRVEQLLQQYVEEHRTAGDADPRPYLNKLDGIERVQLEVLIDEYLQRAPRRDWDASAYAQSRASVTAESLARSVGGEGGLWPSLLPRLRNRARIKRADLVAELASRLGAQSKRDKVARYYNQMEQGLLPAEGVSDSVLTELGRILGQTAETLRQAGRAVGPSGAEPSGTSAAFARMAMREPDVTVAQTVRSAAEEDWDEVDQLFRGGS